MDKLQSNMLKGIIVSAICLAPLPISAATPPTAKAAATVAQDDGKTVGGTVLDENGEPVIGATVTVIGQLRSFNNKSGQGSRLVISTFAQTLTHDAGEPLNRIFLSGVLCKQPALRRTPLGREICDMILAVNRRYGRADYLPCIAWGAVAQQVSLLHTGARLTAEGRVQSRVYSKTENGVTTDRTAYEVSIMRPADRTEFPE